MGCPDCAFSSHRRGDQGGSRDVLPTRFWKHWPGGPLPRADTMGKVHSKMDTSTLRDAMRQVYGQLKRNKAMPDNRGISLAVVDGHEGHTS